VAIIDSKSGFDVVKMHRCTEKVHLTMRSSAKISCGTQQREQPLQVLTTALHVVTLQLVQKHQNHVIPRFPQRGVKRVCGF
jgi:hypothetical protein